LGWRDIPLSEAVDTKHFRISANGAEFEASAVSVGNPHCVLFVENAETADVRGVGSILERHSLFPQRTNVEFVEVISPGRLRMRVWERGVGITRACGTGACAAAVAAHRRGVAARKVEVVLDGGSLDLEWRERDDHVLMTGPSVLSYSGDIDLSQLETMA
jgi:diaminopimelate epimerase